MNDRVVEGVIAPLLVGQDALATGLLWDRVLFKLRWANHSFAPYSALSGVDIALGDLKGKLLGLPVSDLLGGRSANLARPTPWAITSARSRPWKSRSRRSLRRPAATSQAASRR